VTSSREVWSADELGFSFDFSFSILETLIFFVSKTRLFFFSEVEQIYKAVFTQKRMTLR